MSPSQVDNFYPTRARLVPSVPKEFQRNTFRQISVVPPNHRANPSPPRKSRRSPPDASTFDIIEPPKRSSTTSPKPQPSPLLHHPLVDSILPSLSRNPSLKGSSLRSFIGFDHPFECKFTIHRLSLILPVFSPFLRSS
jgi:hypothetical protein